MSDIVPTTRSRAVNGGFVARIDPTVNRVFRSIECGTTVTGISLTAPDSEQSSGDMKSGLQSISGVNVTSICDSLLFNCYLKKVDLPNLTTIGAGAFQQCSGLKELNLPKVTTIGSGAFRWYNDLLVLNLNSLPTTTIESQKSTWKLGDNVYVKCSDGDYNAPDPLYISVDNGEISITTTSTETRWTGGELSNSSATSIA